MNSRERVIRAIEFDSPDRIPIMHAFLPSAVAKLGENTVKDILDKYPHDFSDVYQYSTMSADPLYQKGTYRDDWGCVWVNARGGILGQVKEHPLRDLKTLRDYEPPDPLSDPYFTRVEKYLKSSDCQGYTTVDYLCFFERMQWLRGLSNVMVDLIRRPSELTELAEIILDYNVRRIQRWGEIGVDEAFFGDDWGHQRGLMVSPSIFRQFFKPHYEKMFDAAHKAGMRVQLHSDGYVLDLIPDFIDMKVDVLNVQMTIIGIEKLGALFGGKICFRSDLDCQHILPFGTPEDVSKHVKQTIRCLGSFNGGLIGCAEIGDNVPLPNVVAVYESFRKYGNYPIASA